MNRPRTRPRHRSLFASHLARPTIPSFVHSRGAPPSAAGPNARHVIHHPRQPDPYGSSRTLQAVNRLVTGGGYFTRHVKCLSGGVSVTACREAREIVWFGNKTFISRRTVQVSLWQ